MWMRAPRWSRRTNNFSGLALSVTFGDSSPKGRASGLPEDFASPFGKGGCGQREQTERARTLTAD